MCCFNMLVATKARINYHEVPHYKNKYSIDQIVCFDARSADLHSETGTHNKMSHV